MPEAYHACAGWETSVQGARARPGACAGGPRQVQQPGPTCCCQAEVQAPGGGPWAPASQQLGRWSGCQAQGWQSLLLPHPRQAIDWLHLLQPRRPRWQRCGHPCQPFSSSCPSCAACAARWRPAAALRCEKHGSMLSHPATTSKCLEPCCSDQALSACGAATVTREVHAAAGRALA